MIGSMTLNRTFETPAAPATVRANIRKQAEVPAAAANPLERMAQLVRSNDLLMGELEKARGRVVRARLALETPAGNTRLGSLYLEHCKSKHRGVLAQLRANRIEANRLLGFPSDAGDAGDA